MARPTSQPSSSQSTTSFVGDPDRWTTKPPAFTGGFAWINKDAGNVKSKSHIAKVRAHVRNEYRYWKPGDPPKSSGRDTPPSPVKQVSVSAKSPSTVSTASSNVSSPSRDEMYDDSSPATSVPSPSTASSSTVEYNSALTSTKQPGPTQRKFFDPVRGSETVLEIASGPRKEHQRISEQIVSRPMPAKLSDPANPLSDAETRAAQSQPGPPLPPRRSKHESSKLLREVRDYNMKQAALQNQSLQTSIGGLRDDPFLSFPIESRKSVIEAADYWVNNWAPSQTPSYIKAGSWKPTVDKIFSATAGDEGAFESQVALAQSYMARNRGIGEEPSKEVLYHQTRAMLSLRKHLEAGSVTAGPLLSSLNLLILSIVHADRKAYDFHRMGLERMVQTPPPNATTGLLHAVIKGYFVTSRFYFRLLRFQNRRTERILLNAPKLKLESKKLAYPKHPFYSELSTDVSTLPSGFGELALDLVLPIQLIHVLTLIAAWNRTIAPQPQGEKSNAGVGVYFTWDDTEECLEVLEQLPRLASNTKHRNPAYPLCLTLMLYSITAHSRFHATRIFVQLVRDAVQAIRLLEPGSRAQQECRLWMAVVVSGCARDAGAGNARIKINGLLAEVARDEHIGARYPGTKRDLEREAREREMNWQAVETIMKRFFWYEHFAANWRTCWEVEIRSKN